MKPKLISRFFLIVFILSLSVSCSDPVSVPSEISLKDLLGAPEIIHVDGRDIKLETEIYLNLQPIVSDHPMIAMANIQTTDSTEFPDFVYPVCMYIIKGNEIWKSFFSLDNPGKPQPFVKSVIARGGPYWGPGINVDAVVGLMAGDKYLLIKATRQPINAVY